MQRREMLELRDGFAGRRGGAQSVQGGPIGLRASGLKVQQIIRLRCVPSSDAQFAINSIPIASSVPRPLALLRSTFVKAPEGYHKQWLA